MTAIGTDSTATIISDSATGASVTLSWSAVTAVGNHRSTNEDSYVLACPYFAVADGMGGHSAGDVASDAVVRHLAELATPGFADATALEQALLDSVADLRSQLDQAQQGAGTTVTGVALVQEEKSVSWMVFNIGDSRVYALDQDGLRQVTVDHSVVQQLVDAGTITKEEADVHPHANVITRAVGISDIPIPDYAMVPVVQGTRLLLCSDGLTKEITDAGIEHFLAAAPSVTEATSKLMSEALGNSGRDNITIVVIDVIAVTNPLS